MKLRTTHDADGNEAAETLELINTRGTKVRSDRMVIKEGYQQILAGDKKHSHNAVHLNFLRGLDGRSVEILCIDGYTSQEVPVEFLKEALGFGNVRTLILSRGAVNPCLSALNEEPGGGDNSRWFFLLNTLIIYPGAHRSGSYHKALLSLLNIAQKRKVVGFPLKSILLFLWDRVTLEWQWDQVLEKLRSSVEKLEVFTGDDVLDWDADKFFLDGLEHLRENRDIRWD